MAKSSLPSVDSVTITESVVVTDGKRSVEEKTVTVISSDAEGYAPRLVDVRMNETQAVKFKALQRKLEDEGAKLADGSFVNNRRRAMLWLVENHNG